MPNTYPPTSSRRPLSALPANAGPQPGKRTALITLQEELQVLTGPGLVGARRMKIMRIDQSAAGPQAMPLPRPTRQEPILVSAQPATASHGALPPPQQQPAEFEGMVNGQRVHLRGVGETLADEAGNLYEVRGQHLRPLGALVSDEHGRIFEVQPAREAPLATTESPQASASAPEQERFVSATNNGYHVELIAS